MTDIRDAEPQPPDDSGGYCCVSAGMHEGHDEDCPLALAGVWQARIKALERRVRAADALMKALNDWGLGDVAVDRAQRVYKDLVAQGPGNPKPDLRTDVRRCARCSSDHLALAFSRLLRPIGECQFWAACPTTGEPIILKSTVVALAAGKE